MRGSYSGTASTIRTFSGLAWLSIGVRCLFYYFASLDHLRNEHNIGVYAHEVTFTSPHRMRQGKHHLFFGRFISHRAKNEI